MTGNPGSVDAKGVVQSLAGLGFPGVSECSFYPDAATSQQLCSEATLRFPAACCVCDAPGAHLLAPAERKGWLQRLTRGPLIACVPHCVEHAKCEYARLVVHTDTSQPARTKVRLVGLSAHFLTATVAFQQQGDRYPPWRAFPAYAPETSDWRQGLAEDWMGRAWNPFWDALGCAERAAYLDRWQVPTRWRDWLQVDVTA